MAFAPKLKRDAVAYFDAGHTIQETCDYMAEKYPEFVFRHPTISTWVKQYRDKIGRAPECVAAQVPNFGTPIANQPRILHFDIETLPNEGYFFDIYSDRGIALQFVKRAKAICCLAYKWHGDENVRVIVSSEPYSDKNVCAEFRPIYDQADYIVGHYAEGFDIPFLNGRMFANGLQPLADKKTLDTYKIAKQKFGKTLNSNRLDHLAELLGVGKKNKTDAQLWVDCAQGKPEAIAEMAAYNAQDVVLLEKVFMGLRPWFNKKLNANLFKTDTVNRCRVCNSDDLALIGYEVTAATMKPQFRCNSCGAVSSFKPMKEAADGKATN